MITLLRGDACYVFACILVLTWYAEGVRARRASR
jgi:hypothetical protein